MVTYLFSLFTWFFPYGLDPLPESGHWNFIFIIFSITFILPSLNIGLFRSMGTIGDVTMPQRKERILPFVFISVVYLAFSYLFYSRTGVSIRDNVFRFIIITNALLVVATLSTLFYKVSIHSLAAWGMVGILLPLNKISEDGSLFYPLVISIVVAGLVMFARLQLQVHTGREVMIGAILGLATSFAFMTILF